jgi:hypothetical protein
MPGAGLSHGPPAEKNAGGRYHRFSQDIPAFPAQWLYGLLRVLPGAPGFLATVTRDAKHHHERNTSVGVSGPRDLTVRIALFVGARPSPHCSIDTPTASPPNVRDDRETPLLIGHGTAQLYTQFLKKRNRNILAGGA